MNFFFASNNSIYHLGLLRDTKIHIVVWLFSFFRMSYVANYLCWLGFSNYRVNTSSGERVGFLSTFMDSYPGFFRNDGFDW